MNHNKSLIQIHIAVFLFGLSGLFGKILVLPPIIIVFGRVIFSSIFLLAFICYKKESLKLKRKSHYFSLIMMGIILAVHWYTFFKAIQVSSVATGLLTFSTFPIFVTFLEPHVFNGKLKLSDIMTAALTFIGIVLVVPSLTLDNSFTYGALFGVISGFTYAILSILNKRYVKDYSSAVIAFYQQFSSAIVLAPFFLTFKGGISGNDLFLLILLGVVFTGVSHMTFISGLKSVKAQTAGIISSLEPLYGILFAAVLLNELPSLHETTGGLIILTSVFYSTLKSKQNKEI